MRDCKHEQGREGVRTEQQKEVFARRRRFRVDAISCQALEEARRKGSDASENGGMTGPDQALYSASLGKAWSVSLFSGSWKMKENKRQENQRQKSAKMGMKILLVQIACSSGTECVHFVM